MTYGPNITWPFLDATSHCHRKSQDCSSLISRMKTNKVDTVPGLSPPSPLLLYSTASHTQYIEDCKSMPTHSNLRHNSKSWAGALLTGRGPSRVRPGRQSPKGDRTLQGDRCARTHSPQRRTLWALEWGGGCKRPCAQRLQLGSCYLLTRSSVKGFTTPELLPFPDVCSSAFINLCYRVNTFNFV